MKSTASLMVSTTLMEMISSLYSVFQSFSVALCTSRNGMVLFFLMMLKDLESARTSTPILRKVSVIFGMKSCAASLCTTRFSIALQTAQIVKAGGL